MLDKIKKLLSRNKGNEEVEYRAKKKSKFKFKQIIPIVIVLVLAIVVAKTLKDIRPSIVSKDKKEIIKVVEEKEVEVEVEVEEEVEKEDIVISDERQILTYNKNTISLYNKEEELLDTLDLDEDIPVITIVELESDKTRNSLLSKTNELSKAIQEKKDTSAITKEIESLSEALNSQLEKEEAVEKPQEEVNTEITAMKSSNGNIAFKIGDTELLVIFIQENKIVSKRIEIGKIDNSSPIYIDETSIYVGEKEKISVYDIETGEVDIISIFQEPNNIIALNGSVYYSANTKVYKIEIESLQLHSVNLGENTEDLFIEDGFIYAINDFGKGKDNSILAKMDLDTLYIEDILELKGKRSKFVSVSAGVLQIEQADSVKTVDLENYAPLKSYKKTKVKSNGFVIGDFLYELIDNDFSKTNIKNKEKEPSKINSLDGFLILSGKMSDGSPQPIEIEQDIDIDKHLEIEIQGDGFDEEDGE